MQRWDGRGAIHAPAFLYRRACSPLLSWRFPSTLMMGCPHHEVGLLVELGSLMACPGLRRGVFAVYPRPAPSFLPPPPATVEASQLTAGCLAGGQPLLMLLREFAGGSFAGGLCFGSCSISNAPLLGALHDAMWSCFRAQYGRCTHARLMHLLERHIWMHAHLAVPR